jgi:uncharacterized repeat protein (TIGR01451 family)
MRRPFINTAYAVALAGAMLSGSMLAMASSAKAQTATAVPTAAKSPVSLLSVVKIERVELDATGKEKLALRDPKDVVVVPGDKVLFTLNVSNSGAVAASGFRATNQIPGPVIFVSAAEDWADVSVDGGTNWGKLGELRVMTKAVDTGADVLRAAAAEDVTHVRWVFADAIAPASKRSVSYRGIVK